jgi:hypothetical protein
MSNPPVKLTVRVTNDSFQQFEIGCLSTLDDFYKAIMSNVATSYPEPYQTAIARGVFNICVNVVVPGMDNKRKNNFMIGTDSSNPWYWPLKTQSSPALFPGVTLLTGISWAGGSYSGPGGTLRRCKLLDIASCYYHDANRLLVLSTAEEVARIHNLPNRSEPVWWGLEVRLVFSDPRITWVPMNFTVEVTPINSNEAPFAVSVPANGSRVGELVAKIKQMKPGAFDDITASDVSTYVKKRAPLVPTQNLYEMCLANEMRLRSVKRTGDDPGMTWMRVGAGAVPNLITDDGYKAWKFYIYHNTLSAIRIRNMSVVTKLTVGNNTVWINDTSRTTTIPATTVAASLTPLLELAMSDYFTMDPKSSSQTVATQVASVLVDCRSASRTINTPPLPIKFGDGTLTQAAIQSLIAYSAALGGTIPYYVCFNRYALVSPSDAALKIPYLETSGVLKGSLLLSSSKLVDGATIDLYPLPSKQPSGLYTWSLNVAFLIRKGLWRTVSVTAYSNWTVVNLAAAVKQALMAMPVNATPTYQSNSPTDRTAIERIAVTATSTNVTFMTEIGNVALTGPLMKTPVAYQDALVYMYWGKGNTVNPNLNGL